MEDDLTNAGAIYRFTVLIDDNIITTAHYKDMGPWMKSVIEKLKNKPYNEKFNLLGSYPNPKNKRYGENLRTIKHRIIASYRGKEFMTEKNF